MAIPSVWVWRMEGRREEGGGRESEEGRGTERKGEGQRVCERERGMKYNCYKDHNTFLHVISDKLLQQNVSQPLL